MKTKYKILSSCLVLSAVTPLIITSVSCNKFTKYDKIAEKIKTTCIDEFIKLSVNYRDTYHTKAIAEYLGKWATDHGFTPTDDKATYKPDQQFDNHGWNVMFDVPASTDGQNIPPIILQGHTDMVLVGATEKVKERGVKVVTDGKFLHSENNESSLGADNGIGVATMLSIAIHKDEFTHGPIRMIFSTDEEDGNSGAAKIPNTWLQFNNKNIEYLINCDSERYDEMSIACGGARQGQFKKEYDESSLTDVSSSKFNKYKIHISGLKGGHSALEISSGKINAIKLMSQILSQIAHNTIVPKEATDPWFPHIMYGFEGKKVTDKVNIGTIPSQMTLEIATPVTSTIVSDSIKQILEKAQGDHPTETDLSITFKDITSTSTITKALSEIDSLGVCKLINELPYGVITYSPKYGNDLSSNIASLRFVENEAKDKMVLTVDAMARGYEMPYVEKAFIYYTTALKNISVYNSVKPEEPYKPFATCQFDNTGSNTSWLSKDDEPLQKTLSSGASKAGISLKSTAISWWLEVGAFNLKAKELDYDIHMASIGVTVYDAHSVNERIDTETIAPFIKMLLFTLEETK